MSNHKVMLKDFSKSKLYYGKQREGEERERRSMIKTIRCLHFFKKGKQKTQ